MGTGLGLATVYGIVRQSRGWVRVRSDLGKGSLFEIYLPRTELSCEAARAASPSQEPAHGSETVLVVEDQPEVRRLTLIMLGQHGYHLLEASNGAEALEVCAGYPGPIHLLLTDIVMPGMNGRELAARLQAVRPSLRVMYTSGYTADVIGREGVLDPGVTYLAKPFTTVELMTKLREALA